jgi:hypothetical protein
MPNELGAHYQARFLRIAAALACLVAALVVGRLAGWDGSGHNDAPGHTAVFWVIVLSVITVVVNVGLLLVDRVRARARV